ncbi:hypothetical protein GRJ2_001789300 [Grus japonensis]|uniref:Uncharacterized protein n=1 Tax=Grus japonensis TaxID=30415 RepID=A0ABC9X6C6_GRUJA
MRPPLQRFKIQAGQTGLHQPLLQSAGARAPEEEPIPAAPGPRPAPPRAPPPGTARRRQRGRRHRRAEPAALRRSQGEATRLP